MFLETFEPDSGEYLYYIFDKKWSGFIYAFGVMQRFYKRDLRRLLENDYFEPLIWEEL